MLFQKNQKKISSILKTIYKSNLDKKDIDNLKKQIIQLKEQVMSYSIILVTIY